MILAVFGTINSDNFQTVFPPYSLLILNSHELHSLTLRVTEKLPEVLPDTASVPHHYCHLRRFLKGALEQASRCGMSTRGHWDGPVISNQGTRYKVEPFAGEKNVDYCDYCDYFQDYPDYCFAFGLSLLLCVDF